MNPPLRSKHDLQAIKQAFKDDIIDVIASDHAPHTENEKEIEFDRAQFGIIGLETLLSVCITQLLNDNILDWKRLVEKLCLNPARLLGLDGGTLSIGKSADIAIISPEKEWTVDKKKIISKSKNSAFLDKKLKGQVDYTVYKGKVVHKKGDK